MPPTLEELGYVQIDREIRDNKNGGTPTSIQERKTMQATETITQEAKPSEFVNKLKDAGTTTLLYADAYVAKPFIQGASATAGVLLTAWGLSALGVPVPWSK